MTINNLYDYFNGEQETCIYNYGVGEFVWKGDFDDIPNEYKERIIASIEASGNAIIFLLEIA